MRRRNTVIILVLAVLLPIAGAWRYAIYLNHRSAGSDPASHPPGYAEFAAAHITPIVSYGSIIDQNGSPVPEATVIYRANNIPWGGGIRREIKSDAKGEFKITSNGLSLFVDVTKDNYRALPRRSDIAPGVADARPISSGTFAYAKQFAETVHHPGKAHPVVFTLHKSGKLEPLIMQPGKDIVMKKDGSPLRIKLDPGNDKTVVEMQCWTDDKAFNDERHYDWHFKLTVAAGGLVERPDEVAFTAPPSGYDKRTFEYSMAKELPRHQWKDDFDRSFFVRFDNDSYAILDVRMISGGGHFAVVGSRLNPQTGSRNLETAPPKKPKWR